MHFDLKLVIFLSVSRFSASASNIILELFFNTALSSFSAQESRPNPGPTKITSDWEIIDSICLFDFVSKTISSGVLPRIEDMCSFRVKTLTKPAPVRSAASPANATAPPIL